MAATKDIRALMRSRTAFGKLPAKELEEHRKALRYIELIAMQANIPISEWDISKVFRSGASKKLITDPKEINKRIFANHANTKELSKKLALLDVYEAHDLLKAIRAPGAQGMIEGYQSQIKEYERLKAEKAQTQDMYSVKYYDKYIKGYKNNIKNLSATVNTYEDTIRIVNDGFWKFLDVNVNEGTIRFITANNVILFDKNPASKLNLHKDMGQYMLSINVIDMYVWINAFKGNTELDFNDNDNEGYLHPYVSGGGICFGNAANAFKKAQDKKSLYEMVTIIGSVLGTYNSGNGPHITLYQFTKKTNSNEDLRFIKTTCESEPYDKRKQEQLKNYEERLKELAPVIPKLRKSIKKTIKKTKNTLAKAMGKAPVRLARITHDDENDDELADAMYTEEQEREEESYEEEDVAW